MEYSIVPADKAHLLPLAAGMRAADRREVWASHRNVPYEALSRSLKTSERAWTALLDGRPMVMWGVARLGSIMSEVGTPWLLGTDDLKKCWLELLRQSRPWVERMQEGYRRLENYVHHDNRLSIRWLLWCGFRVEPEETIFHGEVFHKFWRKA